LGKQQVVWGQSDGLKVLDVINPQSFREFILQDFDVSRIPLWMINVEIPVGVDDSLQVLWIIDQTYHALAKSGTDYQMTSPLLVPQPSPNMILSRFDTHKPSSALKDSDFGLRYSKFASGWDLTFNFLYHYIDTPVYYQNLAFTPQSKILVEIDAQYERDHLFGMTATKAFGDWTIRSEVGFSTDSFHLLSNNSSEFIAQEGIANAKEFSTVIGLDWQGLQDSMVSIQWFQSTLIDVEKNLGKHLVRPMTNHIVSLLYQQHFKNETWQLEALVLHGFEENDTSLQLELNHMLQDNLKLWIKADIFSGDKTSLFGQFNDTDRLSIGFEWGF